MTSTGPCPTFLIAPNPKRMAQAWPGRSSMVKSQALAFTSGGSTSTPMLRASLM
jgi:hypothetical protein